MYLPVIIVVLFGLVFVGGFRPIKFQGTATPYKGTINCETGIKNNKQLQTRDCEFIADITVRADKAVTEANRYYAKAFSDKREVDFIEAGPVTAYASALANTALKIEYDKDPSSEETKKMRLLAAVGKANAIIIQTQIQGKVDRRKLYDHFLKLKELADADLLAYNTAKKSNGEKTTGVRFEKYLKSLSLALAGREQVDYKFGDEGKKAFTYNRNFNYSGTLPKQTANKRSFAEKVKAFLKNQFIVYAANTVKEEKQTPGLDGRSTVYDYGVYDENGNRVGGVQVTVSEWSPEEGPHKGETVTTATAFQTDAQGQPIPGTERSVGTPENPQVVGADGGGKINPAAVAQETAPAGSQGQPVQPPAGLPPSGQQTTITGNAVTTLGGRPGPQSALNQPPPPAPGPSANTSVTTAQANYNAAMADLQQAYDRAQSAYANNIPPEVREQAQKDLQAAEQRAATARGQLEAAQQTQSTNISSTLSDGSKLEFSYDPNTGQATLSLNGSVIGEQTANPDGSVTVKGKTPDGRQITVTRDSDGNISSSVESPPDVGDKPAGPAGPAEAPPDNSFDGTENPGTENPGQDTGS